MCKCGHSRDQERPSSGDLMRFRSSSSQGNLAENSNHKRGRFGGLQHLVLIFPIFGLGKRVVRGALKLLKRSTRFCGCLVVHRIVVPGTSIPRLAARVERLRAQLSATRFRQEVEVEMLADGLSYFDLSIIENATSQEGAICPRI